MNSGLPLTHPAQECFSFLTLLNERAGSQLLLKQLGIWASAEVAKVGELLVEVSRDADELVELGDEFIADGAIDRREWKQMRARACEISEEARTGKIIR